MTKKVMPKGFGKKDNELFSGLFLVLILVLSICGVWISFLLGGIPDANYKMSNFIYESTIDDISIYQHKTIIHSDLNSYVSKDIITIPKKGDSFEIRKRKNKDFICIKRKCYTIENI